MKRWIYWFSILLKLSFLKILIPAASTRTKSKVFDFSIREKRNVNLLFNKDFIAFHAFQCCFLEVYLTQNSRNLNIKVGRWNFHSERGISWNENSNVTEWDWYSKSKLCSLTCLVTGFFLLWSMYEGAFLKANAFLNIFLLLSSSFLSLPR